MTTREPISIENGRVEIHTPENRVWLTRHQIADLFGVFVPAVGSCQTTAVVVALRTSHRRKASAFPDFKRKSDRIFNLYCRGYLIKLTRELGRTYGFDMTFHKARHNFGTHITLSLVCLSKLSAA